MSGVDVHDLSKEKLPADHFPVSSRAEFRLLLAPAVHRGTWEHAQQDATVEICGVLVGRWAQDENGPFAVVDNFIRCESAASKFAEVTFTHESWAQINREMDTRFADARIIGWYHSHPDFGIFLSDRDCFIQQHFFSGPGQIAYVIDPVRSLEGVFEWRDGKPTLMPHYWVGDSIRTADASRQSPGDKSGKANPALAAAGEAPPSARTSSFDLATTLLAGLALFLLGYMLAGLYSKWDRQMMVEGTVAHYGYNKLMKIGMEENLVKVANELAAVSTALSRLPESTADLKEEDRQQVAKQRKVIINNLAVCQQALDEIRQRYGLSDEERMAFLGLVVQKQAELRKLAESATTPAEKAQSDTEKPAPGKVADAAANPPADKSPPPTGTTDPKPTPQ